MGKDMKKAIIFDCDNTLWNGVIGEDTVIPRIEFQKDIIFLAEHGVIIGLCSRNNEADIMETLQSQLLTFDYISVSRINWRDKVSNLKEIAEELNIGTDAIVMCDDSQFEINMIRENLPEVMCIYPDDLLVTASKYFDLTGDFTKTNQYKEQYQRVKYSEQFTDISSYLASLDMVLSIRCNDPGNIQRVSELTQKTNQFNLTGKRLTFEQVAEMMKWSMVFTLSVSDRFGDCGITGVCMVCGDSIINFMLSCRILGRGIEFAFMDYIINELIKTKHHLFARYIPTDRNRQTEDFFDKLGFEFIRHDNNDKIYYLWLKDYKPKAQNIFRHE